MSFIHDNPFLVKDLLKAVEDFDKKFQKKGQADPNEVMRQNVVSFQAHLKSLQDQLSPQAKNADEISTESDGEVGLKSMDLQNLGSLVSFVALQKITIGGKRIAYDGTEQAADQSYVPYRLEGNVSLIPETMPRAETPEWSKSSFKINKDLLIKYVQSLQGMLAKKPNPVMKVMLDSIIQQANEQLQTNIGAYKEPDKTLPDTTELDSVPDILSMANWGAAGQRILTVGDVKSQETLNAWFSANKVAIQPEKAKPVRYQDQDFAANECLGVKILFMRAQSMLQKATVQTKDQATIYVRQMQAIAGAMKCDLSQVGGGTTQPGQAQQGQGQAGAVSIQQLATRLPFNSEEINTRDLKWWVDGFVKLENDTQVSALAQQCYIAFQNVDRFMSTPGAPIMMDEATLTPAGFKPLVNTSVQPVQLASVLYTCIQTVSRLYQMFVLNHLQEISDAKGWGPTAAQAVQQQVAAGGPAQNNLNDLLQLRKDLEADWKQGYKK